MIKLYALVLGGILLLALNAGALVTLWRTREWRRAVRLLIVISLVLAVSLFFFVTYKIVLLLSMALLGITVFLLLRSRSGTTTPPSG